MFSGRKRRVESARMQSKHADVFRMNAELQYVRERWAERDFVLKENHSTCDDCMIVRYALGSSLKNFELAT